MEKEAFIQLSEKIADGVASPAEVSQYQQYVDALQEGTAWDSEQMGDREAQRELILENIRRAINPAAPVRRMPWYRIAAAAVLVLLGVSVFLLLQQPASKSTPTPLAKILDVAAPQHNRATLTVGDGGRQLLLDSLANGTIGVDAHTSLQKIADGKIAYSGASGIQEAVVYHTLSNPRGSRVIDLVLPDGSHVWLNAASSLRFPVPFSGGKRSVELSGEAYFEVVHNSRQPFMVTTANGRQIEDVGTSFNVNAYGDEPAMKVSLLEGAVKVDQQLLRPGQAWLGGNVVGTDGAADIAWKNGKMVFHDAGAATILRAIGRWYDVQVNIEGQLPEKAFYFEVSREAKLSAILRVLENNALKATLDAEHKIITIHP